jgi:peptidoglycan/xylan/chitin deacetylase (PgdA/CDA1 family)
LLLVLILTNFGLLLAGSLNICSGFYIKAYCQGNSDQKDIALTFDDGPEASVTDKILDILSNNNIRASFFLTGQKIAGNEQIIRRMAAEGHIIGNHSYSHSNLFGFLSTKRVIEDLQRNSYLIKDVSGVEPRLFRPPFGVTNPHIAKAARFLNLSVIGWNIRSLDTLGRKPEKTVNRVIKRLRAGSIILLHDNRDHAPEILEEVIRGAREKGFNFVALDELLNIKTYN